ncbi:hypothetical protein EMIT0P44_240036 [Pseudomonas sp. IT-P44]
MIWWPSGADVMRCSNAMECRDRRKPDQDPSQNRLWGGLHLFNKGHDQYTILVMASISFGRCEHGLCHYAGRC